MSFVIRKPVFCVAVGNLAISWCLESFDVDTRVVMLIWATNNKIAGRTLQMGRLVCPFLVPIFNKQFSNDMSLLIIQLHD